MTKYMHGLALTSFLWPNHTRMRRYFEEKLPRGRSGLYLEIGPGHGFYFMTAMRGTRFSPFFGIDISPTSVELTRRLLESGVFGQFSNFSLYEADFLQADPPARADALVMGEVLEHVEEPARFLRRAREVTTDDAFVFVTTCINSPAFDHIFLFESVDHLSSVVESAGLRISDSLVLPYEGLSIEETNARRLPVNVAMVLSR
jgi:2-polyprenyl-3-methyl-5-hydroxy-6-metoxy-1,4-benzoquinol methylase